MKRFLNTLFITTQESWLSKDGESVLVELPNGTKSRFPFITLEGIVCFGNIRSSPFLLGACAENGVRISFCTEYGKFLWRVQGRVHGNVLLRKEQYRLSDNLLASAKIAVGFLLGKLNNSRTVLERFIREHPTASREMKECSNALLNSCAFVQETEDLESLRGIEGESAQRYFAVFNELLVAQREDFIFSGRNRRPPADKVNALLSFAYTMLYHDVCSALEAVGLDPAVGFLHRDRPGRMSLALDLMEEFRPFFADRLVLSLINKKEIQPKHFQDNETGAVLLTDEGRKIFLKTYQERKRGEVTHPFLNEKMYIGTLFHVQALLLARSIRGDVDGYAAFLWR